MRALDGVVALRYPVQRAWARFKTQHLLDHTFIHINKTGGSSIEEALGMHGVPGTRSFPTITTA